MSTGGVESWKSVLKDLKTQGENLRELAKGRAKETEQREVQQNQSSETRRESGGSEVEGIADIPPGDGDGAYDLFYIISNGSEEYDALSWL